ncbi:hypothetical protein BS78_05G029500 [Paspalum vaginatum]|nr:hypothetical protein BS78_05G029500 [Paspalum vaginatum]
MAPAPSGSASAVSTMLAATATAAGARGLAPGAASARAHVPTTLLLCLRSRGDLLRCRRRLLTARGERPRHDDDEEGEEEEAAAGFDAAVALFNRGDYHACHDVVEELWYGAEDPARTLLHGLLQCAVGFHHLFNQNHRGAMMELGEGLCKLRKLQLQQEEDGDNPFSLFRDEVAAVLHFLYRTQKELAACTDEMCLTMDGSPSSYQLLGNFAAGQRLYGLEAGSIVFSLPNNGGGAPRAAAPRVKLPTLQATEQHLTALQCTYEFM